MNFLNLCDSYSLLDSTQLKQYNIFLSTPQERSEKDSEEEEPLTLTQKATNIRAEKIAKYKRSKQIKSSIVSLTEQLTSIKLKSNSEDDEDEVARKLELEIVNECIYTCFDELESLRDEKNLLKINLATLENNPVPVKDKKDSEDVDRLDCKLKLDQLSSPLLDTTGRVNILESSLLFFYKIAIKTIHNNFIKTKRIC